MREAFLTRFLGRLSLRGHAAKIAAMRSRGIEPDRLSSVN